MSTKVRAVITCGEENPKCVYLRTKLSVVEQAKVTDVKESQLYTCGSSLFPWSSEFHTTIVNRHNITCASPIEASYFPATLPSSLLLVRWPREDPCKGQ